MPVQQERCACKKSEKPWSNLLPSHKVWCSNLNCSTLLTSSSQTWPTNSNSPQSSNNVALIQSWTKFRSVRGIGDNGGCVVVKQLEKNEFNKSALSPSQLAEMILMRQGWHWAGIFVQLLDGFPKLFMIPGVQPTKIILLCFMHLSHKRVVSRLKSCLVPSLFQVLARPKKIFARQ